jgi:cytochrome P450
VVRVRGAVVDADLAAEPLGRQIRVVDYSTRHRSEPRESNCGVRNPLVAYGWVVAGGESMVDTGLAADVSSLPLPPINPMRYGQRVRALRSFHTGLGKLRDAGGPVTLFTLGPSWLVPPVVAVTSPKPIRDVLTCKDGVVEKANSLYVELRRLIGANLFDLPHEPWLPRRRALQPVFTKQHVRQFGGHMAQAAESVASRWDDAAEIDLDIECRTLTMRALGRSVLGLDLDRRADALSEPLRTALQYVTGRVIRPLHAPHWLPTPSRRRAREATATMKQLADDILQACRTDPTIDAPLVHALIDATDPVTGRSLSDSEIEDEMLVFLGAGHDTTATALST